MFTYTEHFLEGKLTAKIGTHCIIRRSQDGEDIMLFLIKHGDVLKLTSDTLTKLLHAHGESVRKNMSKTNKIRLMLKMDHVKNNVSSERIQAIEQHLDETEKRNKKRKSTEEVPARDDEAWSNLEASSCMHDLQCWPCLEAEG